MNGHWNSARFWRTVVASTCWLACLMGPAAAQRPGAPASLATSPMVIGDPRDAGLLVRLEENVTQPMGKLSLARPDGPAA